MKSPALTPVLGLLALMLSAGVAFADPPPWAGHGHGHDQHDDRHDERGHDFYQFSTREQYYIQDWYRRNGPPGHRYGLPPGQAKKLKRGAPWPPPYAYEPLPPQVIVGLQPLPPGYQYYRVGADVVIANIAGHVVADVVYDLLNR
ncbi:hypothetical protein [Halothiobacillus sp. DCM-1]|uniref:hypothetical protein n=1 Tax=Halothiobacillus sp. DCM-1 TaxID=3112558 RepID=UPI0032462A5C